MKTKFYFVAFWVGLTWQLQAVVYADCLALPLYGEVGNTQNIRECIEANADLDVSDAAGNTALHNAIISEHIQIVQLLAASGADLNKKNYAGNTPLIEAVRVRNNTIVSFLCNAGVDLDTRNKQSQTALYIAMQDPDPYSFNQLVEKGANLELFYSCGNTILMECIRDLRVDHIRFLLNHDIEPNQTNTNGDTAIIFTIKQLREHLLDELINRDDDLPRVIDPFDPAEQQFDPAYQKYEIILRLLMEHGSSLNTKNDEGKTALDIAQESDVDMSVYLAIMKEYDDEP